MLQSIEELGIEKGMEKGMEKGIEKVVLNIIKSGMVNIEQLVKLTGIGADYIKKIASKSNISLSYQSV